MPKRLRVLMLSLTLTLGWWLPAWSAGQVGVTGVVDAGRSDASTAAPTVRMAAGGPILAAADGIPAAAADCAGNAEGEPDLVDGYLDEYNGGCNSPDAGFPSQLLAGDETGELVFCGSSGWYHGGGGSTVYRDTDWFWTVVGAGGQIAWTLEAEQDMYGFLLAPQDCETFAVTRTLEAGPDGPATLLIDGEAGQVVWLWIGPRTSQIPPGVTDLQFDYVSRLSGLLPEALPTQVTTWGYFKGLYR